MKYSLQSYLRKTQTPPELTAIFTALVSASKKIQKLICVSSLNNSCGTTGNTNIQGEEVQKLDLLSNDILKKELFESGVVNVIASEEDDTISHIEPTTTTPQYAILIDPLDGSSNIDVNISIGTIFSIYDSRKQSPMDACLQPGRNQIAAGYILYGPATTFILTIGQGVFGFTYNPLSNDFHLSHDHIIIPNEKKYYSINEGNMNHLLSNSISFIEYAKKQGLSTRYVGSLVADFHRNLLKGGIYLYPGLKEKPSGKLRLLYEGNPLAFICEQAGGKATDGHQNILDITPTQLHQRTPLFIGNTSLVEKISTY